MIVPILDDDGYPTEETEEVIRKWDCIGKDAKLLLGAMRCNFLFWSLAWVQSRRGGHYIFEVTC